MESEPQRRRRILVVGAYGLIGAYVLARLQARRIDVVAFGRDIEAAARRFPYAQWIAGDMATMTKPEDWNAAIAGVDAVVNCAGALLDGPRDDLEAVHVEGTLALYKACAAAGVRRVVHVSAAGIATGRPTPFSRSKLAAEEGLKALDLDWLILRPGFVLAPTAYGAVHSRSVVQPVSVEDVAEAVARAAEAWRHARVSIDLVAPDKTTLADLLVAMRGWLGLPPARVLRIPAAIAWPFALVANLAGRLGWRSPMRTTTLRQMKSGIAGDSDSAQRVLGIKPRDLASMLTAWPSGVQERWFARLYFLKPLAILTLALFWMASGVIGLVGHERAAELSLAANWPPLLGTAAVIAGSLLDILLGAMVLVRRRSALALRAMVLLTIVYLVAASLIAPTLWLDPLGPLVKTIPAALLALITLAVMDER